MTKKTIKTNRAAAILSTDALRAANGGSSELSLAILRGCPQCSQVLSFDFRDIVLPQINVVRY